MNFPSSHPFSTRLVHAVGRRHHFSLTGGQRLRGEDMEEGNGPGKVTRVLCSYPRLPGLVTLVSPSEAPFTPRPEG